MSNEWEIRKLYVNGLTICIEFFLFQIFQHTDDARPQVADYRFKEDQSTSILAVKIRPKPKNIYMFVLLANFSEQIFT